MKRWLFFLLLIINSTGLSSQAKLKRDTGYIQPRSFNANALSELKNKEEFQYNRSLKPLPGLWDRFWNWFWSYIDGLLKTKRGRITFWSLLLIAAVGLIIFFVVKITGINKDGLFGRGSKNLQEYSLSANDIHRISFDDAIEAAINSGNYRAAIRLLYLQALKKLSDKGYIEWRINKTNTDYVYETRGKSFNEMFSRLTINFEYTWYGSKQVSREQFLETSGQFKQFNTHL